MQKLWVGSGWKMNKTLSEARAFAQSLASMGDHDDQRVQRFVFPPFTVLREVKEILRNTGVLVGAQNMHWEDSGSWTGEISPPMLVDCNADMVEIGHSERRRHFGETDEHVGQKTAAAVAHGLVPLVCVGETAHDRQSGRADDVIARQVESAFSGVKGVSADARLLVAYEPVWAIGAGGEPATPSYANDRHQTIKRRIREVLGVSVPCLYGGSVGWDNSLAFVRQPFVDGLFIGRSSWQVENYVSIVRHCLDADRGGVS